VLDLAITSCEGSFEAFPQLRPRAFRGLQGQGVSRRLFLQLCVTFGDRSGESAQRVGMFARQTVERVLKLAASALEHPFGFAMFGSESTDIGVGRRLSLLESRAHLSKFNVEMLRHFRETTLVVEALLGELGFEVCLLLEPARPDRVCLLAEQPLGFESG